MTFESWSVVKEKRGIPMKMGVYSALMSSESINYTEERFNTMRYAFDYMAANYWATTDAWMPKNTDPFSGFTYTDARGIHNLSDNPAKAFDGTPNINFNHSNLGSKKIDYYERMGKLASSNNLQMVAYISDNGRGGNKQVWQSNMNRNNQLSGIVASNIYKVELSTMVNSLYKASPNIYDKFYCINEIFSHDDQIININEPYSLLKYFGLTGSGANVNNLRNAHINLVKHIFQTVYDNLPAPLKTKNCLYTGDYIMGDNFNRCIDTYKNISDSLLRGAKIHGIGMQLHIGNIGNYLTTIEDNMNHARSKGFDICVMEFDASPTSSSSDMEKLIHICLNQGVSFFNLCDYRTNNMPREPKLAFFSDNNTPTRFYNAVLKVFNTYDSSKYGKGDSVV